MTAAEKEAQKQEKAEEKEREKERKKQEKLDEKERKKEEKAAATGKQEAKGTPAKKVVKKASSAAASAEIDADSISLSPVAASASSAAASSKIPEATPVKLAKPAKPMAPKKAKKEEWTCPNDTLVHSWENDGVKLLRNFAGQVWMDDDGQLGEWVGLWNKEKKFLDTDAPAPEFEDE